MLRKFLNWNRRISDRLENFLPGGHGRVTVNYARDIGRILSQNPALKVIDVGAGKQCSFIEYLQPLATPRIIGVDLIAADLRANSDVTSRCLTDASKGLPFADASVDMIVSHNVLEHLPDLQAFFAEARRVLKPGGYFIHLLSSRYAPYAVINRLLPHRLSQKLLFSLRPQAFERSGFLTHYDRCYYSAIRKLLRQSGFTTNGLRLDYFQSSYYGFFLPLFLTSAAYELLIQLFHLKNLAAYALINAQKLPLAHEQRTV